MNYQWFPGHMTKAKRMMQENISLVDLVIEVVDARIPQSSRNPIIDELAKNKFRLILLNKADLADERKNKEWIAFFESQEIAVIPMNSKQRKDAKRVQPAVDKICQKKIERDRARGIINRPVRAMVVGIPNVGKSTFINSFAGKACTKTGNMPGVTKGKQWIKLNKNLELLDTPGILWPKFDDQEIGKKLAFIGSMNDQILDTEEMATDLIKFLKNNYPESILDLYGITEQDDAYAGLMMVAKQRNCYKKGQELDYMKAARIVLDEFRSAKIGRITLEVPVKGQE